MQIKSCWLVALQIHFHPAINLCLQFFRDIHTFSFPQKNGHKGDILCVTHCPPSLLATSSYNGEIIVWNVVSGRIQTRFVSPLPAEHQNVKGDFGASNWMMNIIDKSPVVVKSAMIRTFICLIFFCYTGLDTSVPSMIFLKNSKLQQFSSATALLSSGAMGQCYEQH